MAKLGGAIDAASSAHQDVRPAAPQGSQRQPDRLAVPAVSVRLVRNELIPGKRNAAQAEYHRLAASVRYWALKSPNTDWSTATAKGSIGFGNFAPLRWP
ncbi:hypothetical protein ACQ86E_30440 [Bradyrhizobium betae]|uniref:hypothetical protein n=1 Tax=Bradyrhizobium betae TaxID=244734 RepID=UPI003D67CCE4